MRKMIGASAAVLVTCLVVAAAVKVNFSGDWTMDRARSFGMPGNMQQTMKVTHAGDQMDVETRLILPDNERVVKDTYILDEKEREFTPPAPPNSYHQRESASPPGYRTVEEYF